LSFAIKRRIEREREGEKMTSRFLADYKELTSTFERATLPCELVRVLVVSSAWKILATRLFDPKTGDLWPFLKLREICHQHLWNMVKENTPSDDATTELLSTSLAIGLAVTARLRELRATILEEEKEKIARIEENEEGTLVKKLRIAMIQEHKGVEHLLDPSTFEPWTLLADQRAWSELLDKQS